MKKINEVEGYKEPEEKGFDIPIWYDDELGGYQCMTVSFEEHYGIHNAYCYGKHILKEWIRK